jgi:hypothetical protein
MICSSLLRIINAAITPGTHPHIVSNKVMMIDPHPLSRTANGGKRIARITLKIDIIRRFYSDNVYRLKKS